MKKLLALTLALLTIKVSAQIIPTSNPTGSFFDTVTSYFTSFNTNLSTFQLDKASVWAGADFKENVNVSFSLGIEYNLWKSISVESVTRNFGVAGAITSEQLGFGLNFTLHDVRMTGYIDYGYNFTSSSDVTDHGSFIGVGARIKKALTDHTFAALQLEADYYFSRKTSGQVVPMLTVSTGFTF